MAAGAHPNRGDSFGKSRVDHHRASPETASGQRVRTRLLRFGGSSLGSLLLFVASLVMAVAIHLNTPRARRMVAREVNRTLGPSFQGQIRLDRLGGLGLFGLSRADVTIDDPGGRPVLAVRGALVRVSTWAAARSAIFGKKNPITIELSTVSIDALDVRLDTDPAGKLDLLDALSPRTPSAPADPNARGLRLVIPRIALKHAWAHGHMDGAPALDIDLDDFLGSVDYAPDVVEGDVVIATIAARGIARGNDLVGSLQAHVKKPSDPNAKLGASLAWRGAVGSIAHTVRASLDEGKVDAVIDVPAIRPEGVRAFLPSAPVASSGSAHVEAHGTLPTVAMDLRVALGQAAFNARATAFIGVEKTAKLSLDAHDIDLHQFTASVPPSRLGVRGDLSAAMSADGALVGDAAFAFLGGSMGANGLPPVSIRARVSRPQPNELRANAEVVVEDPAAPTRLTARLSPKGESFTVAFALDSNVPELDRLPELHHALRGSCRLAANGSVDFTNMTLNASLEAAAESLVQGANSVKSAAIDAHAEGAVAAPRLEVALHSKDISAGSVRLASVDVLATGRATSPHVAVSAHGQDLPDIEGNVDLGFANGLSLSALRVVLARAGERALATANRVTVASGDFRVDEARIEGLGAPTVATLSMAPGVLHVRASTDGIDLARVSRLARLEKSLQRGTLAFNADVDLRHTGAFGRSTLDLSRAAALGARDLSAHLQAQLDGRRFAGTAHAQAAGIGYVDVQAPKIALGGAGALSLAAWRQAFGDLAVDVHVDLTRLAALVSPDKLPLGEARGEIAIQAHVARDDIRDLTPDMSLSVMTHHLVIAPKTHTVQDIDGVYVMTRPAWRLAGIDFNVDAKIDGDNGFLKLSTELRDAKGQLAQLEASTARFPYGDVLHHTGRLSADLRTTPFELRVIVPERGLGGLPDLLKQPYVTGKLHGEVTAAGTILVPKLHASVVVMQSKVAGTTRTMPIQLELAADYDGAHGKATIKGNSEGHEQLDAEAQIDGAVAQFLDASGSGAPWQASARAHLSGFPLETIVFLDDKLVAGQLSGDVSLTDLHRDAHADVALSVDALHVGNVAYKSARVDAKMDGRTLDATIHIDQNDGFVETKARASASWGAALAPALGQEQPLQLALSAKNFRVSGLLPFVDKWLDELDGRLDADTRIELDPKAKGARLSGALTLNKGAIEATAGGGEFHDIAAKLNFSPDGVITLEKLSAAGMTGALQATGSVRLDGTSLQSARAVVLIPSEAPIPLSAGGAEIGNVDGRLEISEVTQEGRGDPKARANVKIEVPHLRVSLPEGSSKHALSLGSIPKVRVGAHRGHPLTFVLFPVDSVKRTDTSASSKSGAGVDIHTHLADVQVVRGTQLKIDLTGQVEVKAAEATDVTGQIQLQPGGSLEVQGRKFQVESGTITFVGGDPSNPEIVVKAGWTAPDGTVVYANFVGPLKTGKVTLTAQPPLSQQEIVELLLFGTTGGKQSQSPSGSPATNALGTVGGEAAQPINHALSQLGLGAVSAKVDTSESSTPKPEVEVQIARDISLQIAVVLGQLIPGVNPDRTLVTLDWRFLSKWSLSATLGDAGSAIFDLLWQKRY
jgi:translocation and assembly module TamB